MTFRTASFSCCHCDLEAIPVFGTPLHKCPGGLTGPSPRIYGNIDFERRRGMGEHCARDVPVGFRWPFVTLVVLSSWTADSLRQLHTNTSESIQHQITMFRERIRTVFNEEDATMPPGECVP